MNDSTQVTSDETLEALRAASEGLFLPSESDAPFEAFCWQPEGVEPSPEGARALAAADPAAPVDETTLAELLGPLGEAQDWHDEADREQAARFRALAAACDALLTEPRVYRVGRPDVTVLAVGRTADGRWVGLRSAAVET